MKIHTTCRVCNTKLKPIISLGEHYISNFPKPNESDGIKVPLDLMICPYCKLVQLKHTVDSNILYHDNYWYKSGTNNTMKLALADIANKAENLIQLNCNDSVLDIGANDGTLLAAYKTKDIYKIGFDPVKNMYEYSKKIANKVIVDFFNKDTFNKDIEKKYRKPKIITSIAMFYDLDNPHPFINDIKSILDSNGLWIIQLSYLPLMLKYNEFGNICHEHLEYYSMYSIGYLLAQHNFDIVDVELNDVNGGSFRLYVRNHEADIWKYGNEIYRQSAIKRVQELKDEELKLGLDKLETYQEFGWQIERIKNDLVKFIIDKVFNENKTVYIYGSSTKGNTVLQYLGLDNRYISKAVERNPAKWGRMTVGTHIPIISEEEGRKDNPDYFLVLPWHFLDEFKKRETKYLKNGGRFILPSPYFTLV
jgi:SAM-dependent methyltransferase